MASRPGKGCGIQTNHYEIQTMENCGGLILQLKVPGI